jgi:hypothetical protein
MAPALRMTRSIKEKLPFFLLLIWRRIRSDSIYEVDLQYDTFLTHGVESEGQNISILSISKGRKTLARQTACKKKAGTRFEQGFSRNKFDKGVRLRSKKMVASL